MESTDRVNGLVRNQKAINERISSYQKTCSLIGMFPDQAVKLILTAHFSDFAEEFGNPVPR